MNTKEPTVRQIAAPPLLKPFHTADLKIIHDTLSESFALLPHLQLHPIPRHHPSGGNCCCLCWRFHRFQCRHCTRGAQGISKAPRCPAGLSRPLRRCSTCLIPYSGIDVALAVIGVEGGMEGRKREKFHASRIGDVEDVTEREVEFRRGFSSKKP